MAQGVPGRLRPRIFLTFQHYKGGRSSAKHTGRLYPRRNPWYSLSEAESTSGHRVLSGKPRKKSPVTPLGIDPMTVRLVAQCLNPFEHKFFTQKVISRSIYNLKIDTIYMYDIPFDRSFLQLSNGIRHVMPFTDRKLELTAKASMAQPVSQTTVCSNGFTTTLPQAPWRNVSTTYIYTHI